MRVPGVEQGGRLVAHEHGGFRTSTAASASNCFWPPDSRCAGWSASAASPNRASASRTRVAAAAGEATAAQREGDVLGDRRHHDLGVGVGEHEADPAAHRRALARGVQPVDEHPARGRHDEPVQQPREGRLAGAVRPHDADPPLGQLELDVPQRHPLAEPVRHPSTTITRRPPRPTPAPPRRARPRPGRPPPRTPPRRTGPPRAHQPREQPDNEQRAGRPPRMPQRDRAAVGADATVVGPERVEPQQGVTPAAAPRRPR